MFVLLSPRRITNTCFESIVLRVSKVRIFKDSIGLLAHGKKKEGNPKIAGEKMFRQKCLGYVCFKLFPFPAFSVKRPKLIYSVAYTCPKYSYVVQEDDEANLPRRAL